MARGVNTNEQCSQEEEDEEGNTSDDDLVEEGDGVSWFGMGMTKMEKMEARRPWRNSLIIKLVGRSIGYQFLWRRIQAMWKTQGEPMLIDLSNNFFIVKLNKREEYERALLEGPWMIGDNYLHVQKWRPRFRADKEEIHTMPVWVRFPVLPVECYTIRWLKQAGNHIGRTVKVDFATLLASRGRFARVCVEVDLDKPLMAGYVMRGEYYRLQYEGLADLCFTCGRYGHRSVMCLEKTTVADGTNTGTGSSDKESMNIDTNSTGKQSGQKNKHVNEKTTTEEVGEGHGEWSVVQRGRRRPSKENRGILGTSNKTATNGERGGNRAEPKQNPTASTVRGESTVKADSPANRSPKIGRDTTNSAQKISNQVTGSRFSELATQTEGEDDVEVEW